MAIKFNPLSGTFDISVGTSFLDSRYLSLTSMSAANALDLTDAGATTLHKHDHGGMDGLTDDDHTQYLVLTPGSSTRNLIQPTDASYIPLTIKGAASHTANHFQIQNSSDVVKLYVNRDGCLVNTVVGRSGLSAIIGMQTGVYPGSGTANGTGFYFAESRDSNTAGTYDVGFQGRSMLVASNANATTGQLIGGLVGNYLQANVGKTATATNVTGLRIYAETGTATGTFTITASSRGILVDNYGTWGGTTSYGIYIDAQTGTTNPYALYTNAGLVRFGDIVNTTASYQVDGVQVVSNRVVDARIDDTPNSGDATTDGILAAIQTCLVNHGLAAAS